MDDRLRELRELLHAERVSLETAIACFTEADVEEGFMRAFESGFRRQAGQFTHQTHEVNGAHLRDE